MQCKLKSQSITDVKITVPQYSKTNFELKPCDKYLHLDHCNYVSRFTLPILTTRGFIFHKVSETLVIIKQTLRR